VTFSRAVNLQVHQPTQVLQWHESLDNVLIRTVLKLHQLANRKNHKL